MDRTKIKYSLLLTMLLAALTLAVAELLTVTLSILLLIFAGLLFGVFLNGISGWLTHHTPLRYHWSLSIVVTLFLVLVAAGFYYMGSQAVQRASELYSQLQSAAQNLPQRVEQFEWAEKYLPEMSEIQQSLTSGNVFPKVMKGLQWVGWAVTGALVIFFVGLYMAFDPSLYRTGLVKLVPRDRRERAIEVLQQLHSALGHWIVGRLISMSLIGIFTAIGLSLLGVPLPITLGVLAALLTFIPNIGPILAAIPQALLALEVGANTALYVILFNIGLQTVESYLITPIVQRYEVTLPPALTISAQLLMGILVGVIGIMMAAPLTVVAMVLVQMLYIHDRLDDRSPGELADS